MTYEAIRSWAGVVGLFIFVSMFALVILYVFWPGNKARFERARHLPLEKDEGEPNPRDRHGL
jgi:cytochrome c oxidase cbb3-type subunit IV